MDIIQTSIKANQRQMHLNRRSISALKSGRGKTGSREIGGVWIDETGSTITLFKGFNAGLLRANAILRDGMRDAARS